MCFVLFPVKPRILKDSFSPQMQLKCGQEFTIDVKFIGEPMATAEWRKDKKVQPFFTAKFWKQLFFCTFGGNSNMDQTN